MSRGNPINKSGRGFRGKPRGRGRGADRGRGRGRGGGGYDLTDEIDFVVQKWSDNSGGRGYESPGSRGRGRGGRPYMSNPNSGSVTPDRRSDSPRGRGNGRGRGRGFGNVGDQSPRGRGRGRGGSKLRPDAPLSSLLYSERPLLRPIKFVRSVHTLFQKEEEIFQAAVEEVGEEEKSHVPTADRVSRVFSGANIPRMDSSASEDDVPTEDAEALEEIDFEDMARLADLPTPKAAPAEVAVVEEKFTGFFIDPDPTPVVSSSLLPDQDGPTSGQESMVVDESEILSRAAPIIEEDPPTIIIDPTPASTSQKVSTATEHLEETTPLANNNIFIEPASPPVPTVEEEFSGFFIDTTPTPITSSLRDPPIAVDPTQGLQPLGHPMSEQDEVIVYVAPHPRSGRVTPSPTVASNIPSFPSTSLLTGTTRPSTHTSPLSQVQDHQGRATPTIPPAPSFESVSFSFPNSPSPRKQPRHPPVFTVSAKAKATVKARRQEARATRRRTERKALFGSFGAIMSEAQLRGESAKRDPRWEERRRGDSDIDWGDGGEGGGGDEVDEVSSGLGGMDLDPELEFDVEAMKGFARGMESHGGRFVTMDDIADEERMRKEDEEDERGRVAGSSGDEDESDGSSDDDEADAIIGEEEEGLIGEPGDRDPSGIESVDSEDDDSSADEDGSPRAEFQARLERLRANARNKQAADASSTGESSDEDDVPSRTWADEDEAFLAEIDSFMDDNEAILTGRDRRARNRIFQAIRDGTFANMNGASPPKRKKDKDIPPELREQWEKDREKKAANKRARAQARLELAADPFSLKKGGKKGRKAMLAAARQDPTITVIPNRIIDMVTLEQQIRRFIEDVGGRPSMSLPPMNKQTRKEVHELALAFNLKSVSKGKGEARYTTLTKTTRSGLGVNEQKIAKIVRSSAARGGGFVAPYEGRDKGKGKVVMPRHKDGDEVGKAAPKIGESNIGFKMLASMGWAEGDRIGVTGGLHVPLTAVIKNTKLGLGANR